MKSENFSKIAQEYTFSKIWAFIMYIVIAQMAVSADSNAQQDIGSQSKFNAPLPFLQSNNENLGNLTKDEFSRNSTESPEYTTYQQYSVPNLTTSGNSGTDSSKPPTTWSTTESPEVTSKRNDMAATTYQPGTKTTNNPNDIKSKSYHISKVTADTDPNNTTISPDLTDKITNEVSLTTKKKSNHSITTKPSVSPLTEAPSGSATISSVITGSSVTNKRISKFTSTDTMHYMNVTIFNSTDEMNNSTVDPSRLARTFADDIRSGDSFWPIAMALTIGLPTIVVLAVTITVLYRRRLSKPRSLLAMYGQDYNQM